MSARAVMTINRIGDAFLGQDETVTLQRQDKTQEAIEKDCGREKREE